jgi:adenylate cyclase
MSRCRLAMVRNLLGNPAIIPGYPSNSPSSYAAMEWLELKGGTAAPMTIPVDENAATLIPYRGGQGSFRYISITDVLNEKVPKDLLSGRIASSGTTAPGLMDLRATPVGAAYPGVEIHANLIAGMLDGAIKHKPPYILGADVLLVLLAGGVMVFPAADAFTVPRHGGWGDRPAPPSEYQFQFLARIQRCVATCQR